MIFIALAVFAIIIFAAAFDLDIEVGGCQHWYGKKRVMSGGKAHYVCARCKKDMCWVCPGREKFHKE